jgi:opacity protein-like surface antigen
MRSLVLALVSSLAVVLTAASSSAVAARPVPAPAPAITDWNVQVGGTWTNPDTQVTTRNYTFTLYFTHNAGEIGFQTNAYLVGSTQKFTADSITTRERAAGTGSLSVQLAIDVSKTVYFKLFLFKPGIWVGNPPVMKGEVIYETTGTYSG